MVKLNNEVSSGLDIAFAYVFDGIEPISLSRNFGAQVSDNFDSAASQISLINKSKP